MVNDLGPVPQRTAVAAALVRRLVAEQLPEWAGLRVEPVDDSGWDNATFHLGDELLVRLPTAAEYAQAVDKEHRWLPVLAPRLPLPVPVPVARGAPTADFPHPWSVYRWLVGVTASPERIAEPVRFAEDLADFLLALQGVDAGDGPRPGVHCWFRGASLRTFDGATQRALDELGEEVDTALAGRVWAAALAAAWDGEDRWFHGDVAEGNLLLDEEGQLAAVIDFGTCGVGDPSCDLAVAWTLLTPAGRQAFRSRLAVDPDTWARGRGWALWKTLQTCATSRQDPADADAFARARRVLDTILTGDGAG